MPNHKQTACVFVFCFFFLPDSYFTRRFHALGIGAVSEEFLRLRFLWTLTKRWSRLDTDSSASLCTRVSVCLAFSTRRECLDWLNCKQDACSSSVLCTLLCPLQEGPCSVLCRTLLCPHQDLALPSEGPCSALCRTLLCPLQKGQWSHCM